MNTYRIEAVVDEDGTLAIRGVPFQAGAAVEVIVLEQNAFASDAEPINGKQDLTRDYLNRLEVRMFEWASASDEVAYSAL